MILHSIEIEHIRGIEHLKLDGLPETGVVVISGDNEAGKSTILDALHTVLYIRHGSKSQFIRSLQPVGQDIGPRIQLEATVGPYRFHIDKTYLRKKSSRLRITAPRLEQFMGLEADQKLEEIISEHLDHNLFEALFMRQGQTHIGVQAVGIPSLVNALEQDQTIDTSDDSALMRRIDAEYSRYFTMKTGNPAGEYKAALARLEQAQKECAQAEREYRDLEGYIDRHRAASEQLEQVQGRRPLAEAELAEAETRNAEAVAARENTARLKESLETAQAKFTLAEKELLSRKQQREHIQQLQVQVAQLAAKSEELRLESEHAAAQKTQLKERFAAAQKDASRTSKALAEAQRVLELSQKSVEFQRDTVLAAKLVEAENEVLRLQNTLPNRLLTQADIDAVERAQFAVQSAEIRQAAAATKISLSATLPTEIIIDGQELEVGASAQDIEVVGETTFVFGDITAVVRAGSDGEVAQVEVAEARRKLQETLQRLDCVDLDAARAAKQDGEAHQTKLSEAKLRLEALLPQGESLQHIQVRLSSMSDLDFSEVPEVSRAQADVSTARKDSEAAEKQVALIRSELDAWVESDAFANYEVHKARLADVEKRLLQAQDEAEHQELLQPLASLEAHVDELRQQRIAAHTAYEEARAMDTDASIAAGVLDGARAQLRQLGILELNAEKELAELQGRIAQVTGIAERTEQAQGAVQRAETQLAAIQRRAEAVQLLRTTLLEHREIAREKYAEPFVAALTHLAKPIFGNDVGFTLTQELQIEQRQVKNTPLKIDALSVGAQEQLSILTRLAIAQLVSEDAVPIIIDDALGSTDSSRIGRMSALFTEIGKQHQVLILTCDQSRYLRIVGAKMLPIEELKR